MNVRLCRMGERTLIRWVLAILVIVAGLHGQVLAAVLDVAQIADQVSVDSYMGYLQDDLYAHDGDDRANGPGHDLARQRIQERFEGFGLSTSLDTGVQAGIAYSNVVGVLPGAIRPREIYIVGAHYDTAAGSPGAWDNASGVAGVLEAARVLSQYVFETTIVFIAFDREEVGFKGSEAYAKEHAQDDIRAMISLDCIAHRPYQPEHPDFSKVLLLYSSRRTELLDDLANALGAYAGLTCVTVQDSLSERRSSDHRSFDGAGFAAAALFSQGWTTNPVFLHEPSDSVDTPGCIDYQYGTQIARGTVGYLATQARLEPVRVSPDFNGDWKVDIQDLTILIEHWGQDDPSYDIAPPPLGDGMVDSQDLEGLMHYWGQEIPDPALVARWKLDETDGMIAHDGVGTNDAIVVGSPIWRPEGGKVDGALELNGFPNFATAKFLRNPSEGPLSVFAWVKGGAPGQVVISQQGGANWLMSSAADGALMTDLKEAGRSGKALVSGAVVTDDAWHRVGFTWDGTNRILYVDEVEVARDTQSGVAGSAGGLYLGAGKGLEPGSFWAGLIDDVRLYDRAVTP